MNALKDVIENEIFKGIHKDCGALEICNYKETGCGDCPIRHTLIEAEKALSEIQQYRAKAIDEFVEKLKKKVEEELSLQIFIDEDDLLDKDQVDKYIDEIAEQMKAGGENEID